MSAIAPAVGNEFVVSEKAPPPRQTSSSHEHSSSLQQYRPDPPVHSSSLLLLALSRRPAFEEVHRLQPRFFERRMIHAQGALRTSPNLWNMGLGRPPIPSNRTITTPNRRRSGKSWFSCTATMSAPHGRYGFSRLTVPMFLQLTVWNYRLVRDLTQPWHLQRPSRCPFQSRVGLQNAPPIIRSKQEVAKHRQIMHSG
jgi:hypothetical protein